MSNQLCLSSDDHGFSPLHWSAFAGRGGLVDMLIAKGARINATNMGDDTCLHLASAQGHKDVVHQLLRHKADINAVNEHGNTALHYACFWGYQSIAEELITSGALVNISNKYGETPLDKCRGQMQQRLHELAAELGQDVTKKIPYKDQSWLGTKSRSRDATLSRYSGLTLQELHLQHKISSTPSGETWRGVWQRNNSEICAKFVAVVGEMAPRIPRDFSEEFPRLRIFSHPNVLPVIGCVNSPPNLVVVNQHMQYGSLYQVLHEGTGIVVDTHKALKFAIDIARGMAFLHTLNPLIPRLYLSSKHVMV
jgi:integrin-linked kinase